MRIGDGLRVAVTGAAGFIGRAVVDLIDRGTIGTVDQLRLNDVKAVAHPTAVVVRGSFAETDVRARLVGEGVDILFHLASLPGGAAERDRDLGKQINLDGSIALLDAVASERAPVIVYASSIAALGRHDKPVTADTALRPGGSYGTHKAMIEFYLADLTRQGVLDGRSVRPAGIVARPRDSFGGFATAWMSDLFHAAIERRDVAIPAREDAHIWLQSIDVVARNLAHAATIGAAGLAPHRAWTLPALVVRIDRLAEALRRKTGNTFNVRFMGGDADLPSLDASDALRLGFVGDGDLDTLIDTVLARLHRS